jgi:histidine triad (HIT) family protein
MVMNNCVFCKIVKEELPTAKVFENEHVLAFLDISQATKGHTLIIPKVHQENIYSLTPDVASNLFEVVPTIAKAIKSAFQPRGMNLINNNEAFADQSVFHYHLHLIPRYDANDGFRTQWQDFQAQYSTEDLKRLAAAIQKQIEVFS